MTDRNTYAINGIDRVYSKKEDSYLYGIKITELDNNQAKTDKTNQLYFGEVKTGQLLDYLDTRANDNVLRNMWDTGKETTLAGNPWGEAFKYEPHFTAEAKSETDGKANPNLSTIQKDADYIKAQDKANDISEAHKSASHEFFHDYEQQVDKYKDINSELFRSLVDQNKDKPGTAVEAMNANLDTIEDYQSNHQPELHLNTYTQQPNEYTDSPQEVDAKLDYMFDHTFMNDEYEKADEAKAEAEKPKAKPKETTQDKGSTLGDDLDNALSDTSAHKPSKSTVSTKDQGLSK